MKFGHYLQYRQTDEQGSFLQLRNLLGHDLYWVDYKLLKKTISAHPDKFNTAWDSQLTDFAVALQHFRRTIRSDAEWAGEKLNEYIRINKEALRKSAKKYDKKVGCPQGQPKSENMLIRMTNCVLKCSSADVLEPGCTCRSAQYVAQIQVQSSTSDRCWTSEDEESIQKRPLCRAVLTSVQKCFRRARASVTKKSVGLFLSIFVFAFIVAGESMMYKAAKDKKGELPFIEATVIVFESTVSVILGSILAFLVGGREMIRDCIHYKKILKFAPAGVARAIGDILTILVINYVDPSTYMVLAQSKLIITGLFAYLLLPTHPNFLQWYAMFFIIIGILIFKFSHESKDSAQTTTLVGLLVLLAGSVCKGFAASWMDRVLKKGEEDSLISQTVNLAACSIIPAIIFFCVMEPEHISDPLSGWSAMTVAVTFYLLVKNWYVNYIVKVTSAVTKYVIYAVAVLLTYLISTIFLGEHFKTVAFFGALTVCMGVVLYASVKNYRFSHTD